MTQRAAAWTLIGVVVAIGALILSVWLVGENAKQDLRASEAQERAADRERTLLALRTQSVLVRSGCARAVDRDFEALETNRDLRDFAQDAMRARRSSGDFAVARRYEATAASATFRMRRIKARLPDREDEASIAEWCRRLYPEPSQ
jgi:hypothetical protein